MKQVYNTSVSFLRGVPGRTISILSALSPMYPTCARCSVRVRSEEKFCAGCVEHRRRIKENPLSFLSEVHF